jgi:hypothetical protein
MASLVIKDMPSDMHKRLQSEAKRNRRSMTQQALVLLEQGLRVPVPIKFGEPVKPLKPISGEEVIRIIRRGRDGTA